MRITMTACLMLMMTIGCATTKSGKEGQGMTYEVNRLEGAMTIDGNWDSPAWRDVKPIELEQFMGDRPEHFPKTQAKVLYDDTAIHVIFRVEDQYIRAVAEKHQDSVCLDSCVEFFFAPGTDVSAVSIKHPAPPPPPLLEAETIDAGLPARLCTLSVPSASTAATT